MARALNANEFLNKKFKLLEFTGEWLQSFNNPEDNFSMIIYGKSGNGKTEFAIMFAKYMTRFGKVLYNSYEQGHSASLQAALIRQKMNEVGKHILFTHKEKYDEMMLRLKRKKSPRVVVIDSIQYIRLSSDQWKELRNTFPRKIFIMIAHAEGDDPKGAAAKDIEFDVDIKVLVKGYKAYPKSRFGGNQPYMIYEQGHQEWLARQLKYKPSATVPVLPFNNDKKQDDGKQSNIEGINNSNESVA